MGHPAVDNATPFAVEPLFVSDEEGRPIVVPIVKATYEFDLQGHLRLAEKQVRVNLAGEPATDAPLSSYRYEPDVATMRLTVGTQTINVNAATGTVTGGPITIARNATVNISAQFLTAAGTADPVVTSTSFRFDATSANTGTVAFNRSGSFTGTLTGVAAGTSSINFGLFHIGEGHNEFAWPVSVTVTP